ncbi:MAG TPA: hypothetical protein VKF62_05655, partial [Planctomycetota bacterium]|nr:hypothetical protein [Planctomycetota bacterium]
MRGSTTPVLLLLLALLVVGAAVYFALKPASAPVLEVAGPPDATQGHSGPDRTSTVPDSPPSPSRTTVTTTPRDNIRGGNDGGNYANALVGEVKDDQGNAVEGAEVSAQKGPVHAFVTYLQPAATT